MSAFRLSRTVTTDECPWLDADIPAGTRVERYAGDTYGCIGPNGIAVCYGGKEPFFEVPRNALKGGE
jgi:hypothetical protein